MFWKLAEVTDTQDNYSYTEWRNGYAVKGEPSIVYRKMSFTTKEDRDASLIASYMSDDEN